ncbi:MAG: TVP38/TMEM64 family protein [Halovenus sp.]
MLHLIVASIALVAVAIFMDRHLGFLTDTEELRAFIRQYGVFSPIVLIALQALQVVFAPIPGQILAVVAGYLFGAWWGTVYNMIGITVGSSIAFWLSRRFGRAYVESIVHKDALEKFDAIGDDAAGFTLFVLFLIPGLPDDMLCFAGGLTRLPLWQLVAIAVVGRAPAFFLVNVIGEFLGTGQFVAAIVLTALLLAISAVGYLNHDRLLRLLGGQT